MTMTVVFATATAPTLLNNKQRYIPESLCRTGEIKKLPLSATTYLLLKKEVVVRISSVGICHLVLGRGLPVPTQSMFKF